MMMWMRHALAGALIVGLAFGFASMPALADMHEKTGPEVGDVVNDFTLVDVREGTEVSLSDFSEASAIAVIFIATQCPVSNDYNARMAALHERYEDRGIAFLGINPNMHEPVEEIVEHADIYGLRFTIVKDHGNVIADVLDAQVTPEVYLLAVESTDDEMNPTFRLVFHGAIDDNQDEAQVTENYLENALESYLNGEAIAKATTKAFGCTIQRVEHEEQPEYGEEEEDGLDLDW